jgi:myosin heavy subunit
MPKGSDEGFLGQAFELFGNGCPVFKASQKSGANFVSAHYAGDVTYDSYGFLEKNKDTLTEDALNLLGSSEFKFMQVLFPKVSDISSKERKRTLGYQFRTQLTVLMEQLYATEPHYIRCIKPNDQKKPKMFIAKNVFEQLTYSGVFEAVKIRKTGFPFRQQHQAFTDRYGVIFPNKSYQAGKGGAQQLVNDLKLTSAKYSCSKG